MEPLHAVFDSYKLDDLDRSWINQVYDSGFTNIDNVPVDYLMFLTSFDMIDLLKQTCAIVKDWIIKNRDETINERNEVSWETLIALNVEVQGLLAVLAYLMKKGQSFDADQDSRQSCLRATSLYFILLAVPGSNAFQAFQPNLYETALKTFELSHHLSPLAENRGKSCDLEDFTNEEYHESCSKLTKLQSITLTGGLNAVMYDLVIMLKSTSTTMEIRSLEITIYYLIEMTKLANEISNNFYCNSSDDSMQATTNSLAHNAYVALEKICNTKYASICTTSRLIAKYALPQFLIGNTSLPPKQLTIVRETTLYFLKNLLATHGQDVQSAVTIMIQHTMLKCPDRLDGRQKQAAIIVKLFKLCRENNNAYNQCIRDLVRFSHHSKIPCRIFAQEIIGKFLAEISTGKNYRNEDATISLTRNTEKILLASALGRCVDVSSMVRGRAIATFAEFTDSIDSPEVKKLFTQGENVAGEMPSLEELENSIETGNVNSVMPKTSAIIAMLKNRLDDERALVRRSALQILCNAILISPELLINFVPIIRDRCRDGICTVRRFAIRVLTNLLEKFPDAPKLCEYWVDSVVPRIFDSEAKVQEEVLDSLEKLTIAKIVNRSPDKETNNLPWNILRAIGANKMGDHLARTCSIWIKLESITDRTIAHVKSHIEMENNIEAWLLLASISENKMLLDMKKYFDSCSVYLDSENSNIFLASCALRVLKNCWQSFDDSTLRRISQELAEYLKNWKIKVSLIRLCMDILMQITSHLRTLENENERNVENLGIMVNLVRLSEATIARIDTTENDENFGKIIFRATCTLGHASFLSWMTISLETRRILQGFLLEWKSLPQYLREKKELQGVAVAVLGQQALIDRDTAIEMTPIFGRLLCSRQDDLRESYNVNDEHENIAHGPVVRINAAKALADICVRFTSLVEPYLPDMCISMKDPNPEVRQVILVIFIQLLVEDTIKINETFFFHILTMLADVDPTIRDMTVFLIKERLLAKNKQLITQQFINGVYHFNDYERRTSGLNRRRKIPDNNRRMSLAGNENTAKRRMIYDFMLENLDPSGKLTIVVKLTGQILNTRLNRELDVKCEKGICVVRDVLYVVASEHLQVNSNTRQTNDDDNAEEGGHSTVSSVIAEAMKKHRDQVFLPNLVELKRRCEEFKSPLIEDVAKFLIRSVSDCGKEALTNLYNEYPKLDREIQRDIRKYSETREETPEKSEGESSDTDDIAEKQKTSFKKHSMLINPDRMPKIVLRRLSTLTYPGISGHSRKLSDESLENFNDNEVPKKPNTSGQTRSQSSRGISRR